MEVWGGRIMSRPLPNTWLPDCGLRRGLDLLSFNEWNPDRPFSRLKNCINPFLFIRGLFCPSVLTSLTQNCLKLTIPGFPYKCLPVSWGDIGFKKNPRSSTGLEIRPQSAFTAFRALLPSANNSEGWSGCDSPLQVVMAVWRTFF
jgi:hypothetical protein